MSGKFLNQLIIAISTVIIILVPVFTYNKWHTTNQVLSAKTQTLSTPKPSPSTTPTLYTDKGGAKPSTSPLPTLSKASYIIAVFGDSFVDTMGENMDYLDAALKAKYPKTIFKLYNYGIGSQNIKEGLARFDSPLPYKGRNFPPITNIKSDIIVLGSFAYNPFSPHDRNQHYLDLIELANRAKKTGAAVYQLAEIAPLKSGFGKGPHGVNWPPADANSQAAKIVEQLEDAVNSAKTANIPLINAFYPSQTDGKYGDPSYVNSDDGIHPSVEGHTFMADLIVKSLSLK